MKRDKIIYWTATGLIAAGMAMSAFMYLSRNPELIKSFESIGIPLYMVGILGVAKLLGAIALIVPLWDKVKEWAYAGFTFTFIGAIVTHLSTGTPWMGPLIALAILGLSYGFWIRVKIASAVETKSQSAQSTAKGIPTTA